MMNPVNVNFPSKTLVLRFSPKAHQTFGKNPMHYNCCICGKRYHDFGHNPQPISQRIEDRCCSLCNIKVMEARVERYRKGLDPYAD